MSTSTIIETADAKIPILHALKQQLRTIAEQLRAGMDIAPSQRLHIEGMAAIVAQSMDIDELINICSSVGEGAIVVIRDGATLRFDCWQQRAPVYPSTFDSSNSN